MHDNSCADHWTARAAFDMPPAMAEGDKKKPVDMRAERLAEALRANLKRRKAQARRRVVSDEKSPPEQKSKT